MIIPIFICMRCTLYICEQLPLVTLPIVLLKQNIDIYNTRLILSNHVIVICIVPNNTRNRGTCFHCGDTAVLCIVIFCLDNIICCIANGSVIVGIAFRCLCQNDHFIRATIQVPASCYQVTIFLGCSNMVFCGCIAFRHILQLQLIPCQILYSVNFYIGWQIFKTINAIRCSCYRKSSCWRFLGFCIIRCGVVCWCSVCCQYKAVIQFPGSFCFIVIAAGQLQGYVVHTLFVCILDTIVIFVLPDVAFNGCRFHCGDTAVLCIVIFCLDNIICCIANGSVIVGIAFRCLCQNDHFIRATIQVPASCYQVTIFLGCSNMVFCGCIAFRHILQLQLIPCQILYSVNFYIGWQIFKTINAIRCSCYRKSSCWRFLGFCIIRCGVVCWCSVCCQYKAVIQFPGSFCFIVIAAGQLQGYVVHTLFVCILDTVVIFVLPDVAFNRCRFKLCQSTIMLRYLICQICRCVNNTINFYGMLLAVIFCLRSKNNMCLILRQHTAIFRI